MPEKHVSQSQRREANNEEGEILDFNRPDFVFIPKGNHDWRQQGPYLVCKSCEIQHAVWVGPEKVLVGLDEGGGPILKSKKAIKNP